MRGLYKQERAGWKQCTHMCSVVPMRQRRLGGGREREVARARAAVRRSTELRVSAGQPLAVLGLTRTSNHDDWMVPVVRQAHCTTCTAALAAVSHTLPILIDSPHSIHLFHLTSFRAMTTYIPSLTLPSFVFEQPAIAILLPVVAGAAVGYSTRRENTTCPHVHVITPV